MIMLMIMMSQLVIYELVSVLWVMIRWFTWLSTGSYDELDYDQDNDGYHDEPWFNDADGDSNDYDSCDDSSGLWLVHLNSTFQNRAKLDGTSVGQNAYMSMSSQVAFV